MNAPSFRVERMDDGRILLHYYSDRKGLYHIVPGESFYMKGIKLSATPYSKIYIFR